MGFLFYYYEQGQSLGHVQHNLWNNYENPGHSILNL